MNLKLFVKIGDRLEGDAEVFSNHINNVEKANPFT